MCRRRSEEPDHRHGRLLSARRNGPRRHRAAEQRHELAPPHAECRLMPGMGAPSQVPPPIIAARNRQAQAV